MRSVDIRMIVVFIFFATSLSAQDYFYSYFPGNDTDKAYSICKKEDSYIVCGVSRSQLNVYKNEAILFEISENGNINWMNTYGSEFSKEAFDVCYSLSGNIGITGYEWTNLMHNPFFNVLNETGDIVKENYINDNMAGFGFSVINDDEGFSFCGYTSNSEPLGGQVFLVKTDYLGNVLWKREYGDSSEEHFYSHIKTNDNGYLLLGTKDGYMFNYVWREFITTNSKIYLYKLNEYGDEEWNKTISGTYNDLAKCVVQSTDGGYYILGSTQNDSYGSFDMYLIKIDNLGNIEWKKNYGGVDFEYGYDMFISIEGNLYLCGVSRTEETQSVDMYVVKTDFEGNVIWENTYGDLYSDYAYGIEGTSNNGFVIVGASNDESISNGSYNIVVSKFDENGQLLDLMQRGVKKRIQSRVYPNPVSEILYIDIEDVFSELELKIYSAENKVVYSEKIHSSQIEINCSEFKPGVYFVELFLDKKIKHYEKISIL